MKKVLQLDTEIEELTAFAEAHGIPLPEDRGLFQDKYQKLLELKRQYPLAQLKLQSLLLESNGDSSRRLESATKRLEILTGLLLLVASLSFVAALIDLIVRWGIIL